MNVNTHLRHCPRTASRPRLAAATKAISGSNLSAAPRGLGRASSRGRLAARFGLILPAAFALLGAILPAAAQPTNRPGRPDYSAFKLINDRNIFDPRRSGPPSARIRTGRPRSTVVESLTLVGIMNYDQKGPLAFFDGTRSQYQAVLKPADTIAGYKLTDIEPSFVKLAVGTNEFRLPIGMQLRRDDQGKWQLAEPSYSSSERSERSSLVRSVPPPSSAPPPPPPGPPGPPSAPATGEPQVVVIDPNGQPVIIEPPAEAGASSAPPEAAPGGGETDPVLLRLMQRRAQEANQ
jgi:hypothetical protein